MRNFQDILHRNGSLSVVWMVGNGAGPARNLSKNSTTLKNIIKADIAELCDRILEVATIPERLADDEDGYENYMDIRKLAILLFGLYEFYKHQLRAFKRRLDQHYEKIKWRAPQILDVAIDLPSRKKGRQKKLVLATPTNNLEQQSFGEFRLDAVNDPLLAGTPREANLGDPLPLQSGVDHEHFDVAGIDIIDAINATTASRRKRRHTGDRIQNANGDIGENDLLQWLGQNPNIASRRDITIHEDDLITSPRVIALQQDDFPFEDLENGDSLGFNLPVEPTEPVDFNNVQQPDVQQPDVQQPDEQQLDVAPEAMETADARSQNVVLHQNLQEHQITTPLRPVLPIKAVRLARRIQADESSITGTEFTEPKRKRRRKALNQKTIFDSTLQLSLADLKSHMKSNKAEGLGNVDIPGACKKNGMRFENIGSGKKAVELIQKHFGRGMGIALSAFVSTNQKSLLDPDSREVERRRSERSGHLQTPSSRSHNVIPEEESVNDQERHDPEAPEARNAQGIITSGIEERSLPGETGAAEVDGQHLLTTNQELGTDHGAVDLPDQHIQDNLVVHEEIASPYVNNNEFENRFEEADECVPVPHAFVTEADAGPRSPTGSHVIGANYRDSDAKTFHERCPPATTRKGTASLELNRLLKLQKMKKVKLEQDVFYGTITIKPVRQNMADVI